MSQGSEVGLVPRSRFSPLLWEHFLTATFRKCKAFSTSCRTALQNSSSHQSQHYLFPLASLLPPLRRCIFPKIPSSARQVPRLSPPPPHLPALIPRAVEFVAAMCLECLTYSAVLLLFKDLIIK